VGIFRRRGVLPRPRLGLLVTGQGFLDEELLFQTGLAVAVFVQAAATASQAWLRYGWTLVLVAVLLPIAPTPVLAGRAAPVPGFFTSGQWRHYVHDDQSVLSGDARGGSASFTAMRWDNATGQEYRMVGGYFLVPDEHGRGAYGAPIRPTIALLTDIVRYGGTRQITAAQRAAFWAELP
jgi:hypothetical protein